MTENMRYWDALKATDPKYTKPVTYGRKYTAINAQWQIQRMTETFGPIGQGWGYHVVHSTLANRPDYVLAIADVTIWWQMSGGMVATRASYGPVRGMAPITEKRKDGNLQDDDDAGKKAMTDALTKGLSHIGLSADVFLGLYDDSKYVARMAKEFANGAEHPASPHKTAAAAREEEDFVRRGPEPAGHGMEKGPVGFVDGPGSSWGPGGKEEAIETARKDGLMDNAPAIKPEKLKAMQEWLSSAQGTMKLSGQSEASLEAFWKSNNKKLDWLNENMPDRFDSLQRIYSAALDAARARQS